jgi:hypothetical protein
MLSALFVINPAGLFVTCQSNCTRSEYSEDTSRLRIRLVPVASEKLEWNRNPVQCKESTPMTLGALQGYPDPAAPTVGIFQGFVL